MRFAIAPRLEHFYFLTVNCESCQLVRPMLSYTGNFY